MPPRKLSHHHILLYAGDFDRLSEIYHTKRPSEVIRRLVRNHVEAVDVKLREMKEKGTANA